METYCIPYARREHDDTKTFLNDRGDLLLLNEDIIRELEKSRHIEKTEDTNIFHLNKEYRSTKIQLLKKITKIILWEREDYISR